MTADTRLEEQDPLGQLRIATLYMIDCPSFVELPSLLLFFLVLLLFLKSLDARPNSTWTPRILRLWVSGYGIPPSTTTPSKALALSESAVPRTKEAQPPPIPGHEEKVGEDVKKGIGGFIVSFSKEDGGYPLS